MVKITGNPKKINLSTSSFKRMIEKNLLYVDKTKFIESFLEEGSDVQLITRHRRLGKSLNMDTLRCFLTDREDNSHLFKGLYIENSHVWKEINSAPVFYFDFKGLKPDIFRFQIFDYIKKFLELYCEEKHLSVGAKRYLKEESGNDTDALLHLMESVYNATGKNSYILVDEYDKALADNYKTEYYEEIRDFETSLFSAALKGNPYLEKALLTGVMRISRESMFSGLNNTKVYDIFDDNVYTEDYGLTEEEVDELNKLVNFDKNQLRKWYNGICVNKKPIYNTYSVMSFLEDGVYDCYWGQSGTTDIIVEMMNDTRASDISKMLAGGTIKAYINPRISFKDIASDTKDEDFYSLLVQGGYLSVLEKPKELSSMVLNIPNQELKIVWKRFVIKHVFGGISVLHDLFANSFNLNEFSKNLKSIISDRLSYYDLVGDKEQAYHMFLLGFLSAHGDSKVKLPVSNMESGDGRLDICIERKEGIFIFEIKQGEAHELEKLAQQALEQIEEKRYGSEFIDKRVVKVGIAFCKKQAFVKCREEA